MAWPQLMLPQRVPYGLCWKNRCHVPSSYTRPFGSFIQLRSGEKCRYGRYCSVGRVGMPVSSAIAGMASEYARRQRGDRGTACRRAPS